MQKLKIDYEFYRGPERVPHFLRYEVNNKITSFSFSKKN